MKLQSACTGLQIHPLPLHAKNHSRNQINFAQYKPRLQFSIRSIFPRNGAFLRANGAVNFNSSRKLGFRVEAVKGSEPFRGKSGSVSFRGLTHQSIEESKLLSAPLTENSGSVFWILAPVALIASLIVPQFYIVTAIEDVYKNALFAEILSSLSTEAIFYFGLAQFLHVTESVQKPYLQFSAKSWSLITGMKGYLSFAFIATGLKVFAPLVAVCVTLPVLGLHALVSVAPLLAGCLAQYLFMRRLESKRSSCWPIVPIIFEVYRIYQLTRATSFIQKLMYAMGAAPVNEEVLNRITSLGFMLVTFRVLGIVCLWSLLTFLMRLFPSRPVAENY